jgi:hypothetical protein
MNTDRSDAFTGFIFINLERWIVCKSALVEHQSIEKRLASLLLLLFI